MKAVELSLTNHNSTALRGGASNKKRSTIRAGDAVYSHKGGGVMPPPGKGINDEGYKRCKAELCNSEDFESVRHACRSARKQRKRSNHSREHWGNPCRAERHRKRRCESWRGRESACGAVAICGGAGTQARRFRHQRRRASRHTWRYGFLEWRDGVEESACRRKHGVEFLPIWNRASSCWHAGQNLLQEGVTNGYDYSFKSVLLPR